MASKTVTTIKRTLREIDSFVAPNVEGPLRLFNTEDAYYLADGVARSRGWALAVGRYEEIQTWTVGTQNGQELAMLGSTDRSARGRGLRYASKTPEDGDIAETDREQEEFPLPERPRFYPSTKTHRIPGGYLTLHGQVSRASRYFTNPSELSQDLYVFEADFIVFTFNFDEEGGYDLDIRASVEHPYTGTRLGYDSPYSLPGLSSGGGYDETALRWSGDNVGTGVESVYVDLARLRASYPAATSVLLRMAAWWYSIRGSGAVTLDVVAYKGGTMDRKGVSGQDFYAWENSGGVQTADLSLPYNVTLQDSSPQDDAELLDFIEYNLVTGRLQVVSQ